MMRFDFKKSGRLIMSEPAILRGIGGEDGTEHNAQVLQCPACNGHRFVVAICSLERHHATMLPIHFHFLCQDCSIEYAPEGMGVEPQGASRQERRRFRRRMGARE